MVLSLSQVEYIPSDGTHKIGGALLQKGEIKDLNRAR